GVPFRTTGDPVLHIGNPPGQTPAARRRILDAVKGINEQHSAEAADPEIATRIAQYELAFKMQASVPDLMDISKEPKELLAVYGAEPGKGSFANNCLPARRLVARGVRVVELYDADWDHHGGLVTRLPAKCRDVDRGAAALVRDLKRLGLLNDTLVVW